MISRTNISVLLATALLGILLWTVLGIVSEFGKIPAERSKRPAAEEAQLTGDSIGNRADLDAVLAGLTTDADTLVESYRDWMLSRSFPATYVFWSVDTAEAEAEYAIRDNLSLIFLAGNGDVGAMHAMAARRSHDDPLDALTWYDQAIVSGSLYAMLKTADLLELIADPQIQNLLNNARWKGALAALNQQETAPIEKALAWSIAAVTVGGYAMLDHQHAGRLGRLQSLLDPDAVRRACETAQIYVLDTAATIRAHDGTVFSIEQPALALTVPDPATRIPCEIPVRPLVDFVGCVAHPVLAANTQPASLWLCPYSKS